MHIDKNGCKVTERDAYIRINCQSRLLGDAYLGTTATVETWIHGVIFILDTSTRQIQRIETILVRPGNALPVIHNRINGNILCRAVNNRTRIAPKVYIHSAPFKSLHDDIC